MKILVACEYSGRVRTAFEQMGHDVTSCDLLPTEMPGNHYQGDILDILYEGWDMLIAFPPCTDLASSGASSFEKKRISGKQKKAINFVKTLWNAPIDKICIENPVGILSTELCKPTQIIQPFYFGDAYTKKTCLWLKNLPKLVHSKMYYAEPEIIYYNSKKTISGKSAYSFMGKLGSGKGKERSLFPLGISNAMANQWGSNVKKRGGARLGAGRPKQQKVYLQIYTNKNQLNNLRTWYGTKEVNTRVNKFLKSLHAQGEPKKIL